MGKMKYFNALWIATKIILKNVKGMFSDMRKDNQRMKALEKAVEKALKNR